MATKRQAEGRSQRQRSGSSARALWASAGEVAPTSVLREYAFIADGYRGALIGPGGDLAWMCFPSWSDEGIFAGLLGSGGSYRIAPNRRFVPGGYYEDGTLVWHSRFVTERGIFESKDALGYPGRRDRAVILRRICAVEGSDEMSVVLAPMRDYGRRLLGTWRREGEMWSCVGDGLSVFVHGANDATAPRNDRSRLSLGLSVGGSVTDLVVELVAGERARPSELDADECWRRTEAAWHDAVPSCRGVTAAHDVRRSIAVLRGMTTPEGATVAAATTSLPERLDRARNYDYRFSWIRDTCCVGYAGATLAGAETLLDGAVSWVGARLIAEGDGVAPAHRDSGEPIFDERALEVPGYPGGADIVGNWVRHQFQLDVFGEALLLFAQASKLDRLDGEGWRAAEIAIDAIEKRWRDLDAGIWETEDRFWTHSRLISVAGLRAIAAHGAPERSAARVLSLADHIADETAASCLHPTGRWQRAADDERVDASLLLGEIRGALTAGDPRSALTRRAIADELGQDHFLYRYDVGSHRLGEDEGAFLICSFWMSIAEQRFGDRVEATRWFERARSAMSTSGLFSEEFDVEQHQLRGNLPQAFVHALMIEAAVAQSDAAARER